ncbi:cysteine protease inhibitor, partial [Genlisea aurea]
DSNEIDSLAQFAVDQHNTKENALLELVKVVKAEEQVVSGKLHHLTLEVMDAGKKKIYEAKIWVKPWLNNFKELQEFRHIEDGNCDCLFYAIGRRRYYCIVCVRYESDEKAAGGEWESVGLEDPAVQDAARHAIKTIQQRSNSLLPYELSEVLHASVQVVDSSAKFDMFLKLKRGEKEEKVTVEVHRSEEGNFILAKMEDHH